MFPIKQLAQSIPARAMSASSSYVSKALPPILWHCCGLQPHHVLPAAPVGAPAPGLLSGLPFPKNVSGGIHNNHSLWCVSMSCSRVQTNFHTAA
jgi:hypothetical protein